MKKVLLLLFMLACALGCLVSCDFEFSYDSIFCEHVESDWIVDVEASYESQGSKHTECTECGVTIQTQTIPKLELEYSLSEVKELLSKSMVKVYCYDYDGETLLSQGSGFFINKTGTFITNAHVVEDAYYIKIKTNSGVTYNVNVMYVFNYIGSDHAICKAQNCVSTPVEFEENVSVGDIVYAFGYPNDAFSLSSTEGTVTAINVVDGSKTYIENTAKIDHGSSGGILANSKGKVVGITTGILENNKYVALSYSEIKSDVTKNHFGTKEPLEWFHTKKEVSLNASNFDTYFNISVTPTPLSGGSIRYDVTVSLKPIYQYKNVDIKHMHLYICVQIDTDYKYYSAALYGGSWKSTSTSDVAHIYMYNQSDLYRKSTTTIADFPYSNYSKQLYYDYDYNLFSVVGTIVICD